jgi:hypothetical protein
MLPLTYCRKTVVKGGMVSHVGYHDTISVKSISNVISNSHTSRLNLTLEFRIPSFHPHFLQHHFKIHVSTQHLYYAIHFHSSS